MFIGFQVKYPLCLSDFNETSITSTDFQKIFKYQISRKSIQWEQSCSKQKDGQTDMTDLTVALHNFVMCLKMCTLISCFKDI